MNMAPDHHSVSVAAAVVDDDGRVLVIQRRDNGRWEPPGGVLEMNESIPEGVAREVREETGLSVELTRLTGVYKNMVRGVVAIMFRARVTGGTLSASDESSCVEWWTPEDVAERMDPAYAVRLLDALQENADPAVRTHDGVHLIAND
jgi:8-oxo-dGTP diphosphatase